MKWYVAVPDPCGRQRRSLASSSYQADSMADDGNSYRQIFRASSIISGAQALNYLIGLARIKVVALLIGPAGVGLFGVYTSALAFVSEGRRLPMSAWQRRFCWGIVEAPRPRRRRRCACESHAWRSFGEP